MALHPPLEDDFERFGDRFLDRALVLRTRANFSRARVIIQRTVGIVSRTKAIVWRARAQFFCTREFFARYALWNRNGIKSICFTVRYVFRIVYNPRACSLGQLRHTQLH
jgi:hypothetical protein